VTKEASGRKVRQGDERNAAYFLDNKDSLIMKTGARREKVCERPAMKGRPRTEKNLCNEKNLMYDEKICETGEKMQRTEANGGGERVIEKRAMRRRAWNSVKIWGINGRARRERERFAR
jgi:hypothetical protein